MKKILYLGTDAAHFSAQRSDCEVIHFPVIAIVPRRVALCLTEYTHIVFTSKNAVRVLAEQCVVQDQILIAIGTVTADALKKYLRPPEMVPKEETQEGLIQLFQEHPFGPTAHVFLPQSSLSRPLLTQYFQDRNIRFTACAIYDTVVRKDLPVLNFDEIEEIVFTSPSTIKAFIEIFGALPKGKKYTTIGPITASALARME